MWNMTWPVYHHALSLEYLCFVAGQQPGDNIGESKMIVSWLLYLTTKNVFENFGGGNWPVVPPSGDSKEGPGWAMASPDFCLAPPVFFLISRFSSFGWHMQGCQFRFVKIPAILSTAPDLSCVVIGKQHRESRGNQYCKPQLIIYPILADSLHFGVCVTWQSHEGLRQQQQINFAEETFLTRFTTRVIMIWEILR